ncbi:hypothetical protein Fcan01_26651 [Folsomia candida]|uniref:Uncharacterized protein n=1 Tax=Folsomia candida TaxID=158441 RepID=A0A226CZH5_FOLCA|nr:hypothetical protein Fcan01_26651 [Folsomia candida]
MVAGRASSGGFRCSISGSLTKPFRFMGWRHRPPALRLAPSLPGPQPRPTPQGNPPHPPGETTTPFGPYPPHNNLSKPHRALTATGGHTGHPTSSPGHTGPPPSLWVTPDPPKPLRVTPDPPKPLRVTPDPPKPLRVTPDPPKPLRVTPDP